VIDDRFSSSTFALYGLDSKEARDLADLLAEEIKKEMQSIVEAHFTNIVERLNAMGHTLKPEVIALGELSYRDDFEDEDSYRCKLRVAFDFVVSTGYAHLVNNGLDENI
jgi:hypothetical protein